MFGSASQHVRELESRALSEQSSILPETVDKVSAEFQLVEASHGQYIFKSVDFEIMSERHSAPPAPHISLEDEMGWESAARQRGL
jgi:pyruvoyl-dependent arginine decarboxylase (PvlArgDC)